MQTWYLAEGPHRPAVKLYQATDRYLLELRSWINKLAGTTLSETPVSHAVKDYSNAWEAEWKALYPALPQETVNGKEQAKRKKCGQGVTVEYTASCRFVMSMISFSITARRDEKSKFPPIHLFSSLIHDLMSAIDPTSVRLQSSSQ